MAALLFCIIGATKFFELGLSIVVYAITKLARCLVPKMVKNGYKSVFAYLSL
jgi:hypothetical protein